MTRPHKKKYIYKTRNTGRVYIFNQNLNYGKYIFPKEVPDYEVLGWKTVKKKDE